MRNHYLKTAGKVIRGRKEGHKLGFPTANLKFNGKLEAGVYLGWVAIQGQKYKAGIIYKAKADILEAHILDFSGDLYDKKIEIEIGEKIRDIIKFKNNQGLIEQIKKDLKIIKKQ